MAPVSIILRFRDFTAPEPSPGAIQHCPGRMLGQVLMAPARMAVSMLLLMSTYSVDVTSLKVSKAEPRIVEVSILCFWEFKFEIP